jgi:hypothetical protein
MIFFFFLVLGLELRAYTLSYSTSPFLVIFLRYSLENYLPWLASNHNPPDLCLLSSEDGRNEPPAPGHLNEFLKIDILYSLSYHRKTILR